MRVVTTAKQPRWTVALAGLTMLGALAACSPTTTNINYAASDGIRADIGSLAAINLLVVADESGDLGHFVGAFSNPTTQNHELVVELPDGNVIVDEAIDGNGLLNFNAENPITIEDLDGAKPGDTIDAILRSGEEEVTVHVPVVTNEDKPGVDTYDTIGEQDESDSE